jgi:hypothetical protein
LRITYYSADMVAALATVVGGESDGRRCDGGGGAAGEVFSLVVVVL